MGIVREFLFARGVFRENPLPGCVVLGAFGKMQANRAFANKPCARGVKHIIPTLRRNLQRAIIRPQQAASQQAPMLGEGGVAGSILQRFYGGFHK